MKLGMMVDMSYTSGYVIVIDQQVALLINI